MYVRKRTSYVRPQKDILCTSWERRVLYVFVERTKNIFLSSLMHTSIHCTECPAYIYFLHRMSIKRVDHLTSCFNQLQRYFVCHFEPSFDIIITIIITIMTLSMAEYHRMGGSNTKNAKLWDLVVYIHSKQGFWCIKIPDNIV